MNNVSKIIQVDPESELPLVIQIKEQITWMIASRQIQPGENLPSVRQLATRLNVNLNTARSAYKRLESEGLVSAQKGVGTVVLPFKAHHLSRQPGRMRSFMIGVLVPGLNPFFPPFLSGIREAAQTDPSLLLIANAEDSPQKASAAIVQLMAKQVDGLIVATMGQLVEEELSQGLSRPMPPIVYVDQPNLTGQHLLLYDSEGAAYQATRHLIEHGRRRIGLITCPIEWAAVEPCYLGYRRALAEANLQNEVEYLEIASAFTLDEGREAVERLLNRRTDLDAVFVIADVLAIGAMQGIKRKGLNIPNEIALTSYNGIEMAAFVDPPLTTVRAPAYEMGFRAMQLLQRLIAGEEIEPDIVTLPTELHVRHSCGCNV